MYWRDQGGVRRAYGDFRDYGDVGGRREALVAPGTTFATSDPDVAQQLAAVRVKDLEQRRRNKALLGIPKNVGLKEFAAHHLIQKRRAGRVSHAWLSETERRLRTAVAFFGADRDLTTIQVQDIQDYVAHLAQRSGRAGNISLSGGSIRHYLNALGNLYRRAASEGYVLPGYNPVAALIDKPVADRIEARWLEVDQATLLLEASRVHAPRRDDIAIPPAMLHAILATFLLTGGRKAEVLGLAVDDVSFDRKTVTFRPHPWRRLKTRTSHRTVPLWPQLEEILREYVFGGDRAPGRLLFPATRVSEEQPITDLRKALDAVGSRVGFQPGEIRTKMFRHTYCAARLQTLDHGQPVSPFTVAREMGHGGTALVERVYGHLGEVRHRSEVVEYRVEHHYAADELVGMGLLVAPGASGQSAASSL